MAFTRKNLSGNTGAGSNAPTLFTYLGVVGDLNSDSVLKSIHAKGGDIIMVVSTAAAGAMTIVAVKDTTGTLSTQAPVYP